LRKRGARLEADFSGSSRQARTSINGGALDAKTAIGVGLKMLLDPYSEFTSGSFRDIDIVIPPGTVASALPPDGPIFLYWEVASVIMSCLVRALSQALGERALGGDTGSNNLHNAHGVRPDGTPWACSALAGGETGPWGANSAADGDGHTCPYLLNIMCPSSESLEADFPVRIMRKEYAPDSSGPGFNRGGAAILKDIMWTEAAEHQTMPVRFRHGSGVGVGGAGHGLVGGAWIFRQGGGPIEGEEAFVSIDDDGVYTDATAVAGMMDPGTKTLDPGGEYAYYCSSPIWETGAGATWRYVTNGGGGWGNPFERDPERVKVDVRDGYVTIAGAERDFGVVIVGDPDSDPENLAIDAEATAARRAGR
ncbi:MAG: hydantoinase B/oxoprolinase family protein, partial [Actinobacteria bacterium]|nr:hydantoinase B/oxoprolinase family protein [Actinomycetota bacterium]